MPTREEKVLQYQEIKDKLSRAQVAVLANYRGLNVASITKLRRKLRESNGELKVVKNTLTLRAARELGVEGLEPYLEGPTAIAFGYGDAAQTAKIVQEAVKEFKLLEIKCGIMEGRILDAKAVRELADLPPREVLLARVLGGMQAPLAGFAGVLQGLLRSLVYVLEQVRKQKAGEA